MISKSLIGKYFILRQPYGHGQVMLSRGRIAARVDEMFPTYLLEVWPQDEQILTGRSQMIVSIDELKAAFLFDDEIMWQEHFRDIITGLEKRRKQIEAAEKRARRQARERAGAIADKVEGRGQATMPDETELEIVAVDPDSMAELLRRLQRGDGTIE